MRTIYLDLLSETPGLAGESFAIVIIYDKAREWFWVKMADHYTDITHSLTDTQLQAVVEACENNAGMVVN